MSTEQKTTTITLNKPPHRQRNWTWWLIPRPFDLVSTAIYLGTLIPFYYEMIHEHAHGLFSLENGLLIGGATIALLVVDRLEYWLYGDTIPPKAATLLLLVRIIFIEIIAQIDGFNFSPFLYLILPFLAYSYLGTFAGLILALLAWVTYIVKHMFSVPEWLHNPTELHYLVLFTMGLTFSVTMARVVTNAKASRMRTEQLLTELETSHQQLKAYAAQVAELATTRERNRLARDIHDTLGHYLTVINVQLEKALAFRGRRPAEADQAVSDAKRLASEALRDVRHSVSALHTGQEERAFIPLITELVERMNHGDCAMELRIEGHEEGFSRQGLIALYRVVQEGLTNVQKHANARRVQVEIRFGEHEVIVSLRDNGRGFDPALLDALPLEREGGYGLQGIRERLELVNGSLRLQSRPGEGTQMLAIVPKESLLSQ